MNSPPLQYIGMEGNNFIFKFLKGYTWVHKWTQFIKININYTFISFFT